MIVVEIKLTSAICASRDQELGTMIIDNISSPGSNPRRGDYRVRMYRKGEMKKHGSSRALVANSKPTRQAEVLNHARIDEPVQNLVAKGLTAMGYA